jgi:hypothetical protein
MKTRILILMMVFLLVILKNVGCAENSQEEIAMSRWSQEKAWQWYNKQQWLVGCNFMPSTAINQLEMWQEDTFDPDTIDRELKWASDIGFNVIRVYLHDLLWLQDSNGFIERIDKFLAIADKHKIKVVPVLLDSCWNPFPKLGKQPEPMPYVHNSGWVQSPSIDLLKDPNKYDELKSYINGILSHYRDDKRILFWDIYNETGNANDAAYGKYEPANKSELAIILLRKVWKWTRQVNPEQPISVCVWRGEWAGDKISELDRFALENSDIITFHNYADAACMSDKIQVLQQYGRPMVCTEYMSRSTGSTFQNILPILKKHRIGAINWGLVAGKTQTNYPWDSWTKKYSAEPELWFHDIFRTDGTPYYSEEVKYIRDNAIGKQGCQKLGIYVEKGVLIKAGRPYRGIGVNYLSAFDRTNRSTADKSYKEGFQLLRGEYNIPFIRFNISGWWPADWRLYLKEKELYFKCLDEFVHEAEQQELGLIPGFFWYPSTVPDIVGEPMDQLGNPKSKSSEFIRTFTREIVERYKNSPAIWAWECGNEYMLQADIPDPNVGVALIFPYEGTPSKRTIRDKFRTDFIRAAYREFAVAVRKSDPCRLISTGDAILRPVAYHLYTESKWEVDSREQWAQMFLDGSPNPIDSLSVHIYPSHDKTYFPEKVGLLELIGICNEEAKKAGKVLFVGEFGASDPLDRKKEREEFVIFIDAIIKYKIPLSAVWVFDFPQQNADWNITPCNDRVYMLNLVREANKKIAAEP